MKTTEQSPNANQMKWSTREGRTVNRNKTMQPKAGGTDSASKSDVKWVGNEWLALLSRALTLTWRVAAVGIAVATIELSSSFECTR